MKYTIINQNEDKTYSIAFDEDFYKIFRPYYKGDSYFNILYRLYGLLPKNFYHYIGTKFNAHYKPSPYLHSLIYMYFTNKEDAINFADDIDYRLNYLVKKENFI